jgi:WD40 repeat protein/tetratricopeptide (TPR) repeat protein
VNLMDRGLRWCRREPARAAALGTIAAALLVIGVAGLVFSSYLAVANALLSETNTRFEQERDSTAELRRKEADLTNLLKQEKLALTKEQEKLRKVNEGLEKRIQDEVDKRKAEAEERDRKEGMQKQASARLALNYLEQGTHFQDRRADLGTLWLSEALRENAYADDKEVDRIVRLNLRGWSLLPLPHLTSVLAHPDKVNAMACSSDRATVLTGCNDGKARLWDVRTMKPVGKPLEHPAPVLAVALGPESLAATGCADGALRIWDRATGALVDTQTSGVQPIDRVAISPSGKLVAAASRDGAVSVWSVAKKSVAKKSAHPQLSTSKFVGDLTVSALAFRGRLETLTAGYSDGKIRSWATGVGQTELPALESRSPVLSALVDPSGDRLWTGHADGMIRTWNLKSPKLPEGISQETTGAGVTAIDVGFIGPQEAVVLVGTRNGEICLIAGQLEAGRYPWRPELNRTAGPACIQQGEVKAVAWLTAGRRFVTCGADHLVRVWDVPSEQRPRATLGLPSPGVRLNDQDTKVAFEHEGGLAFGADGKALIAGNGLWDAETGSPLGPTFPIPSTSPVVQAVVTRDGRLALILRRDVQALEVWDVKSRTPIDRLEGPGRVRSFVYDARANTVLVAYTAARPQELTKRGTVSRRSPGQAWLWDLETRKKIGPALKIDSDIRSLAVSPDGQWLAAAGQHQVRICAKGNDRPILESAFDAWAIEFLPVGERLAIVPAQDPPEVWFWDVRGKSRVGPMIRIRPAVTKSDFAGRNSKIPQFLIALLFTPDAKTLAACFADAIGFWDVGTGRQIGPPLLPQVDRSFTAAALSPDGLTLATLDDDRGSSVQLWDMPTPIGGSVEQIRIWSQVSFNAELDQVHVIHPLDAAQWEARVRALDAMGRPSNVPSAEPALAKPGNQKPNAGGPRLVRGSTPNAALNEANDIGASPADWKASLIRQGDQHATAGEWKKAAAAYEQAWKLDPLDMLVGRQWAVLTLRADDAESEAAYNAVCRVLGQERRALSGASSNLANLAYAYAIGVNSGIYDIPENVDWAFRGAQAFEFKNAFYQHVLALAYLRAGRLNEASVILMKEEGNNDWFPQINLILHAIVLHHAGNHPEARARYARASSWYKNERRTKRWIIDAWWDQLAYEVLQHEADELMAEPKAAPRDDIAKPSGRQRR